MERNVPKLRFKGFNDEWQNIKLGDICNIIMGQSPSSENYNERGEGIPLIQGNADISNRRTSPRMYTTEVTKTCEISDVIMSVRAPVGSIGRAIEKCCIGRGVCAINTHENQDYLYQILLQQEDKWGRVSQGSTFESINRNDIANLKIKLPSLQEQERIANFLTKVDKIIEKQDEKVKNLEKYKKGMMQKIFSQEIRFKDENGEEYPEWEEVSLSNVLSVPEKNKANIVERNKLLTVKLHMQGVRVNKNVDTLSLGSTIYYERKAGQFIYGKQNFFNGAFGIIPNELDGYLSSGDIPALEINKKKIIPEYLLNYIGRETFYTKTENLSLGTGSKRIHEKTLLQILIDLPTIEEQIKISRLANIITLLIEKETNKLEELNKWKKGLLQQMFV